MFSKTAISVYNPQDPVEQAFQEAYHDATGHWMTMGDLKTVMRCIPTYRGLVRKIALNPTVMAKFLFSRPNTSNLWYYPCDVLDLRIILNSKRLSWHAPIMLFSPEVGKKLLPEYPLCLVFDRKVAQTGRTLQSIHLRESNRLDIDDSLKRIMLRDYLSESHTHQIYRIIKECMGYVPTYLMTGLPGETYEKVAATIPLNNTEGEEINDMGSNWYNAATKALKVAEGPSETFGKEFTIGKQPQIPDPEQVETHYELPHKALNLKRGDRVAYRYTNLQLPDHSGTKNIPMTRSLVQQPKAGRIELIDSNHIHILWDGAKEVQKIPVSAEVFLMKLGD